MPTIIKNIAMLSALSFFDLTDFSHKSLFPDGGYVWEGLNNLKGYMDSFTYMSLSSPLIPLGVPLPQTVVLHHGKIFAATEQCEIHFGDATKGKLEVRMGSDLLAGASVLMAGALLLGQQLHIGRGVLIESGAMIKSPAIIGDMTEVRQGAYLRGYCLAGKSCVIGHTTEVKHSIFLDHAKAGHFAYLGDSILGKNANLGAGTKFANLKFVPGNVFIKTAEGAIDTGRRKFGAILGDNAQTGCNSVTNPGTIIGQRGVLMPNTTAPSGYHPPNTMIT